MKTMNIPGLNIAEAIMEATRSKPLAMQNKGTEQSPNSAMQVPKLSGKISEREDSRPEPAAVEVKSLGESWLALLT